MNVENNESSHQFEMRSGDEVAFLAYQIHGDTIELTHTIVPPSMSGRGIAGTLAQAAFDHARSQHLHVKVICPFVAKWLERHPEQSDIVSART